MKFSTSFSLLRKESIDSFLYLQDRWINVSVLSQAIISTINALITHSHFWKAGHIIHTSKCQTPKTGMQHYSSVVTVTDEQKSEKIFCGSWWWLKRKEPFYWGASDNLRTCLEANLKRQHPPKNCIVQKVPCMKSTITRSWELTGLTILDRIPESNF